MGSRQNPAATTPSAHTRAACATCSRCSIRRGYRHRSLARRWRRHAICLPVSRACVTTCACCVGRTRQRGQPVAQGSDPAGAEYVLPLLLHRRIREASEWPAKQVRRWGWKPSTSLAEVWRSYTSLTDRNGQQAFVHTGRAMIDMAGQRISAHERLYLAEARPTMIVWGDRDRIIPVAHAYRTAEAIPDARLEIIEGAGTSLRGMMPIGFCRCWRISWQRRHQRTCPRHSAESYSSARHPTTN